jgi:lambda family phage tail tape measure protein
VGSIAEQTRGTRPTLRFNGAVKDDKSAEQEAKARLQFDLDQIKKASEAITNTFSNAEKIMEARRSANLVDEREYYAAKLGFLRLNAGEQSRALEAEIARLQQEKLTGKEKIDNDRKIAEARSKIAKVQADLSAGIEVNSIQESAGLKRIQQAYEDATKAAEAYLGTIAKRNQRELEGIGRGAKFREQQSGRGDIDDRLQSERQKLERDLRRGQLTQADFDTYLGIAQQTYAREVELYEQRTAAIDASSKDWLNGASEALQNYADNAMNTSMHVENLFTDAFKGLEDALVDFVSTGKLSFADLEKTIVAGIARIIVQQQLIAPLANFVQGSLKEGGGFFSNILSGLFGGGRAIGGPVSAGKLYRVNENGPELLQMAGKQYLMTGDQGGTVTPAGGGGSTVQQSIVFHLPNSIDRRTQDQIAKSAGQGAQRALSRNN